MINFKEIIELFLSCYTDEFIVVLMNSIIIVFQNVDGENRMCNSLSNILKLATYGPGADQVYVLESDTALF